MFFDNDIYRIAGWNDGNRIAIDSDSLSSPLVQAHEAMHGRIFNETADGQFHKILCTASGRDVDIENDGIYAKVAKHLFVETRDVHEAAATYLSIQGLPSKKLRLQELHNLSKDYRRFYDSLAVIIDPVSKTSWLKYAFGWAFIHWCFYSKRFGEFFSKEPDFAVVLEIGSPSYRFHEAKRFLRNGKRLKNWINFTIKNAVEKFESTGRVIWNIESEVAWNAQEGSKNLQFFESLVTSFAGDWLLDNIPIETDDFRSPRPDVPLFDQLMKRMGFIPTHIFTDAESPLKEDWRLEQRSMLGRAHAGDVVTHAPSCLPTEIDDDTLINRIANIIKEARGASELIILGHPRLDTVRII